MEEDDKENSPKHGPRHGEPTKKSKKRPRGSLMKIETEEEQVSRSRIKKRFSGESGSDSD